MGPNPLQAGHLKDQLREGQESAMSDSWRWAGHRQESDNSAVKTNPKHLADKRAAFWRLKLCLLFVCRIDVNVKSETYCNAIAEGGEKEWDFAWRR